MFSTLLPSSAHPGPLQILDGPWGIVAKRGPQTQAVEAWVVARNASGDQTSEHYHQPNGQPIWWLDANTSWEITYNGAIGGNGTGSHARVDHVYAGNSIPPMPQGGTVTSNPPTSLVNKSKFHHAPTYYRIVASGGSGAVAWLHVTGAAPTLTEVFHFDASLVRPSATFPAVTWTITSFNGTPSLTNYPLTQTVTVTLRD